MRIGSVRGVDERVDERELTLEVRGAQAQAQARSQQLALRHVGDTESSESRLHQRRVQELESREDAFRQEVRAGRMRRRLRHARV
eukprot:7440101-Pyramimonas_sp.AAC.1